MATTLSSVAQMPELLQLTGDSSRSPHQFGIVILTSIPKLCKFSVPTSSRRYTWSMTSQWCHYIKFPLKKCSDEVLNAVIRHYSGVTMKELDLQVKIEQVRLLFPSVLCESTASGNSRIVRSNCRSPPRYRMKRTVDSVEPRRLHLHTL